jgi:nucleoid-associated protein YgaU
MATGRAKMRKDLKTGIAIGVALAAVAVVIMSVWPGASIESRLRRSRTATGDEPAAKTVPINDYQVEPVPPVPEEPEGVEPQESIEPVEQLDKAEAAMVEVEEIFTPQPEPSKARDQQQVRIHVVAGGQTLSSISMMYYGSSRQWKRIIEANPKMITDENRLVPGMRLVIPK